MRWRGRSWRGAGRGGGQRPARRCGGAWPPRTRGRWSAARPRPRSSSRGLLSLLSRRRTFARCCADRFLCADSPARVPLPLAGLVVTGAVRGRLLIPFVRCKRRDLTCSPGGSPWDAPSRRARGRRFLVPRRPVRPSAGGRGSVFPHPPFAVSSPGSPARKRRRSLNIGAGNGNRVMRSSRPRRL